MMPVSSYAEGKNNRRIFWIALGFGLAAFLVNFIYLATRGSSIQVLKAKNTVKAGTPVDESLFQPIWLTGDISEMKNIVIEAKDLGAFTGQPLTETMEVGHILLTRSFQLTGDGGIRDSIKPEQRAVSIKVADEAQAVGYFIKPSDMVDVWASVEGEAFPVIKNVCVQAVGDAYMSPNGDGRDARYRTLTVFVPSADDGMKSLFSNLTLAGDLVSFSLIGKCDENKAAEIKPKHSILSQDNLPAKPGTQPADESEPKPATMKH